MKNSIEEDIELLQDETSSLELFFKCKGSEKYKIALEHILSDYKRVLKINEVLLKENEILKEEKEQAWEEWNNLEQASYETEQKLKQQIKESQKENKELNYKLHSKKIALEIYNRYIPKSKVEDIIEELKINLVNMQGEELLIYESKIDILQELLGESEE